MTNPQQLKQYLEEELKSLLLELQQAEQRVTELKQAIAEHQGGIKVCTLLEQSLQQPPEPMVVGEDKGGA